MGYLGDNPLSPLRRKDPYTYEPSRRAFFQPQFPDFTKQSHFAVFYVYDLGFSPICPRHPGEGWEPSGGGFAPLHQPFGRPAFFVAGPRVTEVSLSGSTRRLNDSVFKVLEIFSFSGLEKRSLHLRAIEKGLFIASIFRFHKTITFHHVLPLMILSSPPFVLDAPGRVGNLLAKVPCGLWQKHTRVFSSLGVTGSTPLCESAHYNDNLSSSLTEMTICHSLL